MIKLTFQILDGGPTGQPVQIATIGQQVYHKWTCDSETVDTFCAIIHSCFVDDGNGDKVELLNEDGCALDKYLLNNLEYPTDLIAGQEAHVYKYADRSQLFYQCQIRITIKEPNSECGRPKCTEPQGYGSVKSVANKVGNRPAFRLLRKRDAGYDENTMDVRADISTLDISDQTLIPPYELRHRASLIHGQPTVVHSVEGGNCILSVGLSTLMALCVAVLLSFAFIVFYLRKSKACL
uniref:ZP domain-containing protein n=1 Tax=Parascaris univalens TaxID=6257 RepID=A0A915BX83_PARUN